MQAVLKTLKDLRGKNPGSATSLISNLSKADYDSSEATQNRSGNKQIFVSPAPKPP